MKTAGIIAMTAMLACSSASLAQQNEQSSDKIKPGTEATGAMSEQVPQMKEDCAEAAQTDTKSPGTEATAAMSEQVPAMTAEKEDCVDKNAAKKTN